MFRYTILTVLLVTNHITAQLYEETVGRDQHGIRRNNQNKINLDPTNRSKDIQDTSYSKPAEASNKFNDEVSLTPSMKNNCTTEEGVSGVCVLYYLCDANTRSVITDGSSILDERFGSPKSCNSYLEVCCELKDRIAVKVISTQNEQFHSSSSPPGFSAVSDEVQHSAPPKKFARNEECGWNRPDLFVFRTASQQVADGVIFSNYGEFPWMVALLKKSNTNVWVQNDYIGGGSIIHPSVVITVNHKLLQVTPEELKCRAGEWDTQTVNEQFQVQERDADRFVSHEEFFITSAYNDIALIFLKAPFDFAAAPHIGTACLLNMMPDTSAGPCFSMGWGKVAKTEATINILKKIKLGLVEHEACRNMLQTNTRFRHIPHFELHKSLTCAGGEEFIDTCQKDGGSPLVCPIGNRDGQIRYGVVGMVAYGLECGKPNVPGVYANIPYLYEWVGKKMKEAGYENCSYCY
ncbi:phenoloxidase-activating factor 2-like isoform X2 [Pararge aegeria]|uniref:phenoloxidase-activating factor 2-like isoform X2 n=1 Tax=Pararge aegeria TaxID=116150 RepID=UPI0019CFF8F1|nr:phenoloxidase-activating factor 2-like isoform X2 [Pararge aegeria]